MWLCGNMRCRKGNIYLFFHYGIRSPTGPQQTTLRILIYATFKYPMSKLCPYCSSYTYATEDVVCLKCDSIKCNLCLEIFENSEQLQQHVDTVHFRVIDECLRLVIQPSIERSRHFVQDNRSQLQ